MDPIDEALAAIESLPSGEQFTYSEYARRFGVSRSTLSRRHRGCQASVTTYAREQRLLNPQQEEELVRYIEHLSGDALPPTKSMIRNFASEIAGKRVGEGWVTRFTNRNKDHLISRWSSGIDRTRHNADSYFKYKLYLDLLHSKMKQYDVLPSNTYNMDEKGFMIGIIGRSKRVFSRRQWEKKEVKAVLQDGSREWITVLGAVCATGEALPPGILYASANCSLQSTWVHDIKALNEGVYVSSTPSGWSNNDVGVAWLEQVFDRHTKQKARQGRDYRLLILDGHGSHVTKVFIDYCYTHRILLAILPPHSTHTLQPLDVALFKPLSSAYSHELELYLERSQGLVPIRKGDFFPLFWRSWHTSMRKQLVVKSFAVTGIWPMDPEPILKRFNEETPEDDAEASALTNSDWIHMERLLRATVKDTAASNSKQLSQTLHQLQIRNELLNYENSGLREALTDKKHHKKRGKTIYMRKGEDYHGRAVLWSPQKYKSERAREAQKQQEEEEEHLQKLNEKEVKRIAKVYESQQKEQRRVEREAKAEERKRKREEKAAQREREKQDRDARKAIQQPQPGKRKASRASAPKAKRQKRSGGVAAAVEVVDAAPARVGRYGRAVKLPTRYTQSN